VVKRLVPSSLAQQRGLGRCLGDSVGDTFADACFSAERLVADVHGPAMAAVDAAIERLCALAGEARVFAPESVRAEIAARAEKIATVAGLFRMEPLGSVAQSLIKLIDELVHVDGWDGQAVASHADVLAYVRRRQIVPPEKRLLLINALSHARELALRRFT